MIPNMYQASFRLRVRAPKAKAALASLGLGLALCWTPSAPAAALAPRIKLDPDDLRRPIVLDQNGQWVRPLNSGSVPTYVGFPVARNSAIPDSYATIGTGPKIPGKTVGPLNLTADAKGRLDTALSSRGEAVVQTARQATLVKPAGAFSAQGAAGQSRLSSWLAAQATAGTAAATPPASTQSPVQNLAQTLKLDKITKPITESQFIKDLGRMLSLKSTKSSGGDQQSLNALKRDVKLGAPKDVTDKAVANGTGTGAQPKPQSGTAAQQLGASGSGTTTDGKVLAAPVPEPSTYLIFGMAAGALAFRRRLGRGRLPA